MIPLNSSKQLLVKKDAILRPKKDIEKNSSKNLFTEDFKNDEVLFLKDKEIYNLGKINEQIANTLKSKNDVNKF